MPEDKKRNDEKTRIDSFISFLTGDNPVDRAVTKAIFEPNILDRALMDIGKGAYGILDDVANDPKRIERNNRQWEALAPGTNLMNLLDWMGSTPGQEPPRTPTQGVPMPGNTGDPMAGRDAGMMSLMEQILAAQSTPAQQRQPSTGPSGPQAQDRYQQYQQDTGLNPEEQQGFGYSVDPVDTAHPPHPHQGVLDGNPDAESVLELMDILEMYGVSTSVQDPTTYMQLSPEYVRAIVSGENPEGLINIPQAPNLKENLIEHAYNEFVREYLAAQDRPMEPDVRPGSYEDTGVTQYQQMAGMYTRPDSQAGSDYYYTPSDQQAQQGVEQAAQDSESIPVEGMPVTSMLSQLPNYNVATWDTEMKQDFSRNVFTYIDDETANALRTELDNDDEILQFILDGFLQIERGGN
jgi:hypothetical protein